MTTSAQNELITRIATVLESEPRIEGAWLAGSLGRGGGDAFSDVDVLVLCADGAANEVSAGFAAAPERIVQPVLVNALFGGRVLNVVTQNWERFDLTFIESEQLGRYDASDLRELFARGRKPQARPARPHATSADQFSKIVNEFLRVLGLSVVVLGRGECFIAMSGVDLLRGLTRDLFLEENGIGPEQRGGALHLNPLLTAEQRALLNGLPPLAPSRESIIGNDIALTKIFLPRAKALAAKIGMAWPVVFEEATRRHLKTNLGMEI